LLVEIIHVKSVKVAVTSMSEKYGAVQKKKDPSARPKEE
jgi:hypothetical protein